MAVAVAGGELTQMAIRIEILFFAGCPHAEGAIDLARTVAAELAPSAKLDLVEVLKARE